MSDHLSESLFESLMNGTLSPEQMRRLNEGLRDDAGARVRFASLVEEWTLIGATAHELAVAKQDARETDSDVDADLFASSAAASPRRRTRGASRIAWLKRDWAGKIVSLAAGLVIAAIIYAAQPWRERDDEATRSVRAAAVAVEGRVTVRSGDESLELERARVLEPGEVVSVEGDARLQLQYPDGTLLDVSGEAQLSLSRRGAGKVVELARGTLRASVARQRASAPMELDTPHVRATVLGTSFTLSTDREQSYLEVAEGRVRLKRRSDGATVTVEGEQYVFAPPEGELEVRTVRPAKTTSAFHADVVWARAATMHVSPDGDDANSGAAGAPMRSITRAARAALPGDVIEVAGGVYRDESIRFAASGEDGLPIVLRASRGADVVVKGSDVVRGWRRLPGQIPVYAHEKWRHYFGKRPAPATGEASGAAPRYADARSKPRNQLFVDGAYVREVLRREELEAGSFFVDGERKTVYVALADGGDPNEHTIEISRTSGPLLSTAAQSHIVVHALAFEHGSNRPQCNGLVRVMEGEACVIDSCRVEWAAGAGLSVVGGSGHVVSGCVFSHNGEMGFNVNKADDCRVERCVTAYNNTHDGKRYDPTWEGGACKVNRARHLTIDRLYSHHNDGNGAWIDISCRSCSVVNGVFHDNRNGIVYEISYGGLIANNLCYGNRRSPGSNPHAPSGAGIAVVSAAGCRVLHNTLCDNESGGIVVSGLIRGDGDGRQVTSHSNRFFNNIVCESTRRALVLSGAIADGASPIVLDEAVLPYAGSASDHNLYWDGGRTGAAGAGSEAHSVFADPQFVDPARVDFRLRPSSPARECAKRLPEVVTDITGASRAGDARPDIGAFEVGRQSGTEKNPWPPTRSEAPRE